MSEQQGAPPVEPDPSSSTTDAEVAPELDERVRADKVKGVRGQPAQAAAVEEKVGPDKVRVKRR